MTAEDALLKIQETLDGVEWNSDTCDDIAEIMIEAGYKIHDLEGRELEYASAEQAQAEGYGFMTMAPIVFTDECADQKIQKDPTNPFQDRSEIQHLDHERIWLEPMSPDGRYGSEGRTWAHDNPFDETDGLATEYVRLDIYNRALINCQDWAGQARKLKTLLTSIVNDARNMQPHCNPDNHYFGPFGEHEINYAAPFNNIDTVNIEWPNLAISVGEAEAYLKELEG